MPSSTARHNSSHCELAKWAFVLAVVSASALGLDEYRHRIYVAAAGSEDAVPDESCWVGGEGMPCSNLGLALEGAQSYLNSTAVILRESGDYPLFANITRLLPLTNMSDFGLLGGGENVSVNCGEGAGLAFHESKGIRIENIKFHGCGTLLLELPANAMEILLLQRVPAGVQFVLCEDVEISSVDLIGSQGTGMTMYGVQDVFISKLCCITNNIPAQNNSTAAYHTMGVYIELVQSNTTADFTGTKYTLIDCRFEKTGDFPLKDANLFSSGMTVYFQNNSQGIEVELCSCTFKGNLAHSGAGLLVYFEEGSRDNSLVVQAEFVSNVAHIQRSHNLAEVPSAGGGMKICLQSNAMNNSVVIRDCLFSNNSAQLGGGIAVIEASTSTSSSELLSNSIVVYGSNFSENHAAYGAAVDLYGGPNPLHNYTASITFTNCRFLQNGVSFGQTFTSSFSVVNTDHSSAFFSRYTLFEGNKGTPLLVRDSIITITEFSTINFTKNLAHNGGALDFRGSGRMIVHSGSHLVFSTNTVFGNGGAIYSDQYNEHFSPFPQQCFFQSDNSSTHPDEWNVTFTFIGNKAGDKNNSIFSPSLIPCTSITVNKTFCWNGWHYPESTCMQEVATSPAYFQQSNLDLEVFPGRATQLTLNIFDELNRNVTTDTVYTPSLIESSEFIKVDPKFISKDVITIYGKPNSSLNLTVETFGTERHLQAELSVTILPCPPAFVAKEVGGNGMSTCLCSGDFGGNIQCSNETMEAFMTHGHCMSFDEELKQPIIAQCPYSVGYARKGLNKIPLPRDASVFDKSVCGRLDREGRLCSQCIDGYGISALSYGFECVKCTGTSGARWLAFILAKFGPITIFFLVIMFFNISVTSAPANAFIFFSQVMAISREVVIMQTAFTLYIEGGELALNVILVPYTIWNLDFFRTILPLFCIDHNLRALRILVLEYFAAFYPLVLIGITYLCIKHGQKVRILVKMWKPFRSCFLIIRQRWNVNVSAPTSIVDAIAAFLLISYTKIIVVSITLLTPTPVRYDSGTLSTQVLWYDGSVSFFHKEHLFYAVPAMFILAVFMTVPPLLLLLYPFSFFQKCLDFARIRSLALHTFVEVFQGCYKDGTNGTTDRRYFAGMYFVFRLVAFTLWATVVGLRELLFSLQFLYITAALLCAVLQPYKVNFYNKLDTVTFGVLAMTSSLMYYLYENFTRTLTISTPALIATYTFHLLPMLYISAYVIYWFLNRKESWQEKLNNLKLRILRMLNSQMRDPSVGPPCSLPDRLIHPKDYTGTAQDEYPNHRPQEVQAGNDQDSPNEQTQLRLSSVRSYRTNSLNLLSRSSQASESQVGHVITVDAEIEDESTI